MRHGPRPGVRLAEVRPAEVRVVEVRPAEALPRSAPPPESWVDVGVVTTPPRF